MKIMNNNSNRGKSIFKAVAVCMAVLAAGLFASCGPSRCGKGADRGNPL